MSNENLQDKYYKNILANIKKHLPEFSTNFENDEQYLVVFELGQFLIDNFSNKDIFLRGIKFIDEALSEGKSPTEEVLAVELFDQFYDKEEMLYSLKEQLSNKSANTLEYHHLQFRQSYPPSKKGPEPWKPID